MNEKKQVKRCNKKQIWNSGFLGESKDIESENITRFVDFGDDVEDLKFDLDIEDEVKAPIFEPNEEASVADKEIFLTDDPFDS